MTKSRRANAEEERAMRGGIFNLGRTYRTARFTGVALTGLLIANGDFALPTSVYADEWYWQDARVAERNPPVERSILVAKDNAQDTEQPSPPRRSTGGRKQLEPIANVSKFVPELADPENDAPPFPSATRTDDTRVADEQIGQDLAPDSSAETAAETPLGNEPITFHGITPGVSLRSEVLDDWGTPVRTDAVTQDLTFEFDGLEAVVVRFSHDRVATIEITLEIPLSVGEMTSSMQLDSCRAVRKKQADSSQAQLVYPERGVTLSLVADEETIVASDAASEEAEPQVMRVVLEKINPEAFLLRAKDIAERNLTQTIADLEQVVSMDSGCDEARRLLARFYLAVGKAITAERYAAEAVERNGKNSENRLQWVRCLKALAQYDQAVTQARQVLDTPGVSPLYKCQAYEELAQLAALGSADVVQRAIPLHSRAIEIADGLANSEQKDLRHAAQCVLIDAHLGIAKQIAHGNFQDKMEAVSQWVGRASGLTEALINEDGAYLPNRLQVAVAALAAATSLEKPIDPQLWVEEAEETVRLLEADCTDPLTCSQFEWQLGMVYLYAADIEHIRSVPESAKKYGELAKEKLADLSRQRDELPDTGYTMGRLYFQVGAVYAVHGEDHETACQWYDQAAQLLLNPVPVTTLAVPQQHGDALVSMGVSYWYVDQRERAVELTKAGVELIEKAVEAGLLGDKSLSIPYENLSAMYQALGKVEPAKHYELLARKINSGSVNAASRK